MRTRLTSLRWPFLISTTSSIGTWTSKTKSSMAIDVRRDSMFCFTRFSKPA